MKKYFLMFCLIIIGSITLVALTPKKSLQEPWTAPSKYMKMKNPELNNPDKERIGRLLYSKHCKSCHGTKGKGDGKKASGLDTKMPDLTTTTAKDQTDGSLYYKTYIGRDDMPSFKKKISDKEDQWLVINYIKKL